jgi:hypothetical protein
MWGEQALPLVSEEFNLTRATGRHHQKGLIGPMQLLNSQVVFMPLQKLKLCLCHSQFSITPSMPFSVYTFVLTKIILCSDLERLLGVSGTQKIQNFQILEKNYNFSEKSKKNLQEIKNTETSILF